MAKKATEPVKKPVREAPVKESKKGNLSEPKSDMISINKYLQLYGSSIHKYTRAGLKEHFRGIIKSKEEWNKEINKIMEGDK